MSSFNQGYRQAFSVGAQVAEEPSKS